MFRPSIIEEFEIFSCESSLGNTGAELLEHEVNNVKQVMKTIRQVVAFMILPRKKS